MRGVDEAADGDRSINPAGPKYEYVLRAFPRRSDGAPAPSRGRGSVGERRVNAGALARWQSGAPLYQLLNLAQQILKGLCVFPSIGVEIPLIDGKDTSMAQMLGQND